MKLPKSKLKLGIIFLIFSLALVGVVINSKRQQVLGTITSMSSPEVTVSATLGERKLTIFGWAPAQAQIKLDGVAIYDSVTAAQDGSFLISGIYLPPVSLYPEICLQAQDTVGRTSQPTCLPRLEAGQYNYQVGPILLSPTLSLNKGEIIKGESAVASGKTTPNTEVGIFLAREENLNKNQLSLVKTAQAYYIPKYQIRSNKDGDFEFNLPTEAVDKWRVFASATIVDNPSPKSNTLVFRVQPLIYSLWETFKRLFLFIKPYAIYLVIAIELVILFCLFKRHAHPLR